MNSIHIKKHLGLTFALLLSLCSVLRSQQMPSDSVVHAFLDAWHQASADANFEAYFGAISDRGIFVGTDEREVWTKEEFIEFAKPYFDQGKAWEFYQVGRNIYRPIRDIPYLWFDEVLTTWMGICRGSGVISYDVSNDRLFLEHYVLSITIPNEKIEAVLDAVQD